jgi:GR25 family glycosyltransferase involved in LPS biosynthesis
MKYPWEQIFIVNLDTDTERLENIRNQLTPLGLSLRKLENRREDDYRDANGSKKCRKYCSKSTLGSYQGHYKIWKKMVEDNLETILILYHIHRI